MTIAFCEKSLSSCIESDMLGQRESLHGTAVHRLSTLVDKLFDLSCPVEKHLETGQKTTDETAETAVLLKLNPSNGEEFALWITEHRLGGSNV